MQEYAKLNHVPIMQSEGMNFLCKILQQYHCHSILEIGSAIGYSAITMAAIHHDIHVTSIEREKELYQVALANSSKSGLQEQITFMNADALQIQPKGPFDCIFIDGAKAQYRRFFEHHEEQLKKGGIIICDNLDFHGLRAHPEAITSRNLRQLIRKIQNFYDYLPTRKDFKTNFYAIGDGISVSIKL